MLLDVCVWLSRIWLKSLLNNSSSMTLSVMIPGVSNMDRICGTVSKFPDMHCAMSSSDRSWYVFIVPQKVFQISVGIHTAWSWACGEYCHLRWFQRSPKDILLVVWSDGSWCFCHLRNLLFYPHIDTRLSPWNATRGLGQLRQRFPIIQPLLLFFYVPLLCFVHPAHFVEMFFLFVLSLCYLIYLLVHIIESLFLQAQTFFEIINVITSTGCYSVQN